MPVISVLALGLCGCASDDSNYNFTAPEGDAAKACISQCSSRNKECRAREDEQAQQGHRACSDRAEAAKQRCEADAEARYNQCLKSAQGSLAAEKPRKKAKKPKTEKERKALEKKEKAEREKLEKERERAAKEMEACQRNECTAAAECFDDPVYSMCDSDFRMCYQDCGGKVDFKGKFSRKSSAGTTFLPPNP